MPSAEIITIGTELLLGQLVDTNTSSIARALAAAGIDVHRETSVGDNEQLIAAAVREALGRSDIAICAGGLGPTVDDLTREAVAAAFGRPLVLHEPSLAYIEQRFAQAGWKMAPNNRRQAMVPKGAIVLDNPHGSAPGFIVDDTARVAIAMPGPPSELDPMLHELTIPWIVKRFGINAVIVTRVLHTVGVGESDLDERIADLFREGRNPSIAVLARPGLVDVKITAKAQDAATAAPMIAALEAQLRERLGDCIYATDDGTFEQSLGEALRARGWSIAVAESCTGGLIAAAIASVPGASDYFKGGVIAYADDAKTRLLGVDPALIAKHGAVSEEVAKAMAIGAREHLHATLAVSTTGIAGPGGGTAEKPVGLVFVALARPGDKPTVRRLNLPGSRAVIQRRATIAALSMAWKTAR